jgi:iron complex outermembrane recepter protein
MSNSISIPTRKWAWSAIAAVAPAVASGQHVIEEVQVVGTPHDQSPTELAQSVTVLTGDTLRRLQGANLGETLAGELGVSSSYFGAGSSRPIIRGLAGARVRTMEDGIDSLDVSTLSVDHAVGIDPLVAEQIEVFRGPVTLLYGSGAVGGVVNTITNRIPESIPEDGLTGAVDLRAGTVADDRIGALRLDGGRNAVAWHFDVSRRDSGDYDVPGSPNLEDDHDEPDHADEEAIVGYVPNSDFEATSAAFGLSKIGDKGFFGMALSGFDTDYGVPGHAHDDEPEDEDGEDLDHEDHDETVRVVLDQRRLDLKGGWFDVVPGLEEINFRLGVSDYEHVEIEDGEVGTRFKNEAYEGRVELIHAPWGSWDGAFGIQFGEREFSAIGAEAFVPPVDTRSTGLFLLERRDVGAWQVSVGGRAERVRHEPSNGVAAVTGTATSLSAAGVMNFAADHSFVVNAALSERVPSAEELFAYGPHLASSSFEIGDPTLSVETSRHVDIGVRKTAGRIQWAVTGFYTSYDDFVYLAETGAADGDSGLPVFAYLQRDANIKGVEAELFATLASVGSEGEVDLRVYGDFVDAELTTGEHLPRIPPRRVGARIQYHDERIFAGFEAVRYSDQNDTAPYETATEGYTLVSADMTWTFPSSGRNALSLFVRATNLLDEEARKHTSLVKDLAPLPGRNYSIGFRAAF